MAEIGDVHNAQHNISKAMERLERAEITPGNKQLVKKFIAACNRSKAKQTTLSYLKLLTEVCSVLEKGGMEKPLRAYPKSPAALNIIHAHAN